MAQERPDDRPRKAGGSTVAVDRFIDHVVAEELEWRRWVRRYPKSSLLVAAIGGLILGRTRGPEIVGSLGAYAADALTEGINDFLGRDVV